MTGWRKKKRAKNGGYCAENTGSVGGDAKNAGNVENARSVGGYANNADSDGCASEGDGASKGGPASLHPLILAYVGDAAYELSVRSKLALGTAGSVNRLHIEATRYSRCESQADVIKHIHGILDDFEKDIVRRARNARPGYIPKHAGAVDYHNATGFEALLGYLYLNNDIGRLNEILASAFARVDERERGNGSGAEQARS